MAPTIRPRLLETIAAFADPAARRDYVMFSVLLGTGLRLSSLVGLDVADVDLRRQRLDVVVKGGHREMVALLRRLVELLTAWVGGKVGPLFCSNRGTRISTRQVQQRLEHWLKAASVQADVTVHGLRHTFGTRLYAATSDLRLVQAALHHRHVSTTERYALVAESRLRQAVEAVG